MLHEFYFTSFEVSDYIIWSLWNQIVSVLPHGLEHLEFEKNVECKKNFLVFFFVGALSG